MKFLTGLLLFVSLGFVIGEKINAEEISENEITKQLWVDFNPSYEYSKQIIYYGEIGYRGINPHEWDQLEINAAVKYIPVELLRSDVLYNEELHGGLRVLYTDNVNSVNRMEIRPYQGYALKWPDVPFLYLQHYLRLEERFDLDLSDWVNTFGLRLRYRAKLLVQFRGEGLEYIKKFYFPASVEFFYNLIGVKQFNDAMRVAFGSGYQFTRSWSGEFDLRYHYTKESIDEKFSTNDIVARISIYYRWD